jgi:hypothetical protein
MNQITPDIYKDFTPLAKDLQGWNGTKPVFERFISESKPRHIIEVGTWKGQSAITMGHVIKKLGLSCTITCVDTWLGAIEFWTRLCDTPERNLLQKHGYPQIYFQFLSNVVHEGMQDIILPFPNTSICAARFFAERKITAKLIYIDASHEYEDVLADLKAYWPLVESGGILFGDDWDWASVKRAVEEFSSANNLKLEVDTNTFWFIRKA